MMKNVEGNETKEVQESHNTPSLNVAQKIRKT